VEKMEVGCARVAKKKRKGGGTEKGLKKVVTKRGPGATIRTYQPRGFGWGVFVLFGVFVPAGAYPMGESPEEIKKRDSSRGHEYAELRIWRSPEVSGSVVAGERPQGSHSSVTVKGNMGHKGGGREKVRSRRMDEITWERFF